MRRKLRKALAVIMVLAMLLAQAAVLASAAAKTITSITAVAQETLIENYSGYRSTGWDSVSQSYVEYFQYDESQSQPIYTVTFSDGTQITTEKSYIEIDGEHIYPSFSDDQAYDNPWGVGKHTVTAYFYYHGQDISCDFEVEVVESPVASVTATASSVLIENYDGYNNTWEGENAYFYYNASNCDPQYTITYKDGTVYTGDSSSIYSQTGYSPSAELAQSAQAPLGVGTHTAQVSFLGVTGTMEVEIIENPVQSVSAVVDHDLIENHDGYMQTVTLESGESAQYFEYDCSPYNMYYTLTLKDGTVCQGNSGAIQNAVEPYVGERFVYPSAFTDQSYDTPWGVGTHVGTVSFLGVEGQFTCEVVETPVASISVESKPQFLGVGIDENAILTVTYKDGTVYTGTSEQIGWQTGYRNPTLNWNVENQTLGTNTGEVAFLGTTYPFTYEVVENPYVALEILNTEWMDEGNYVSNLNVTYRLTKNDGTQEVGYTYEYGGYTDLGLDARVEQIGEWGAGLENRFSLTVAGLTAEGTVEILPKNSEFSYLVFDNSAIITDVSQYTGTLVIPEEIDGYAVVGISSLGYGEFTSITVPDSVRFLAVGWCANVETVETITLGKSVEHIEYDMFRANTALREISVSADNPNYTSVDGVVYSKDMSTLVAYPLGKTGTYTVPAETTNIDILNDRIYDQISIEFAEDSRSYVTVDGVTYTADMKKVMFCDPKKSGAYTMPDSVEQINDRAFADCNKLETVRVSQNVTDIVYGAFADCTALRSITLPDTVQSIGGQAFSNCESLIDFNFPAATSQVGDQAFAGSTALQTVTLNDGLQYIGYSAFSGCVQLQSISIPDSVTTIDSYAFENCTALSTLQLGNGVTSLGSHAFENCDALQSVTIPDNVTYLGDTAFGSCDNLQSATVGSGVTAINSAFSGCTALQTISLPDTLTEISAYDFDDSAYYADESNWEGDVLYLDGYLIDAKEDISGEYTVKAGTRGIASSAFSGCDQLTGIHLPDGLKFVGYSAFQSCKNLKNVTLPDGLETIESGIFDSCTSLENITLPNSLKYIESGAFSDSGVKNIVLPDSVESIGDYAFSDCSSLTNITLPDGLESLGYRVFYSCTSLNHITLPNSLKHIGQEAFYCSAIKDLELPDGLETIGWRAFAFSDIESIKIPDTVTDMVYGFYGTNITEIEMPDTLVSLDHDFHETPWYDAQPEGPVYLGRMLYFYKGAIRDYTSITVKEGTLGISDHAFEDQTNLTGIELPEGLLDIGTRAFSACRNLTDVILPSTLQSIQKEAFQDCALETIEIPASVTEIGENVFIGCANLKEIRVAADNPNYSSIDGVLYNKDGTELIYCPEGKTGTLVLPLQTERVYRGAFTRTSLLAVVVHNDALEIDAWAFNSWATGYSVGANLYTSVGRNPMYLYANRGSTTEAYAREYEQMFVELTAQTDAATDVSVAADTPDSLPADVQLHVEQTENTDTRVSYNITLMQNGAEVQPAGAVTVKIPVPDTMDGNLCRVYREETDGTYTDMNAVYQNGCMVFTTDHFSQYVLTTQELENPTVTLGDVNADGKVDAVDARWVLQAAAGMRTLENATAADVNGDGKIDAVDARWILQAAAGMRTLGA